MSALFPIAATVVIVAATAVALWVDQQVNGAAWDEWRDRR